MHEPTQVVRRAYPTMSQRWRWYRKRFWHWLSQLVDAFFYPYVERLVERSQQKQQGAFLDAVERRVGALEAQLHRVNTARRDSGFEQIRLQDRLDELERRMGSQIVIDPNDPGFIASLREAIAVDVAVHMPAVVRDALRSASNPGSEAPHAGSTGSWHLLLPWVGMVASVAILLLSAYSLYVRISLS